MDKFLSRKFLLTVLSAISGVTISLSQFGGKVSIVCAVISAVLPPVIYVLTEGKIDAEAVKLAVDSVDDVITIVNDKAGYLNGDAYVTFGTSDAVKEGESDADQK